MNITFPILWWWGEITGLSRRCSEGGSRVGHKNTVGEGGVIGKRLLVKIRPSFAKGREIDNRFPFFISFEYKKPKDQVDY
jgi:hypothetical protein